MNISKVLRISAASMSFACLFLVSCTTNKKSSKCIGNNENINIVIDSLVLNKDDGYGYLDIKLLGPLKVLYNHQFGTEGLIVLDSNKKNLYKDSLEIFDFSIIDHSCFLVQECKSLNWRFINRINKDFEKRIVCDLNFQNFALDTTLILQDSTAKFSSSVKFHKSDLDFQFDSDSNLRLIFIYKEENQSNMFFSSWFPISK
jgi:hypothetical protein